MQPNKQKSKSSADQLQTIRMFARKLGGGSFSVYPLSGFASPRTQSKISSQTVCFENRLTKSNFRLRLCTPHVHTTDNIRGYKVLPNVPRILSLDRYRMGKNFSSDEMIFITNTLQIATRNTKFNKIKILTFHVVYYHELQVHIILIDHFPLKNKISSDK